MATSTTCPRLVVVGGPSMDLLVIGGRTHQAPGGAAFITALAARVSGTEVGIVARTPPSLPAQIARGFGPGGLSRTGLIAAQGELPSFRISYDADHRATYTVVSPGMESQLCADDVPEEWLGAEWLHIAAIGGDAQQQLTVVHGLRARGFKGQLSAGTYRRMIEHQPDTARALLRLTDLFFMNDEEARVLLPDGLPAGHTGTVVITHGPRGVQVCTAAGSTMTQAPPAEVVDATGAGDALCGGYLGALITGQEPVSSGMQQAQTVLSGYGGTPLLDIIQHHIEPRAEVDEAQVSAVAAALSLVAQTSALDFADPPHLPVGHPQAVAMLWIATLHQYGFWTETEQGWGTPMYAQLDGQRYKGSDFIWAAFTRAARQDPSLLSADRMAREPGLFAQICTDDTGQCPIPDLASHAMLHQAHGLAMRQTSYAALLSEANASTHPGATLMSRLRTQPGYMGDPLSKKASLLLLILSRRPEKFLDLRDPESIVPIVDYHLMRGCLRTGAVRIKDPDLHRRIEARAWVDAPEELDIRQACGRAIHALVEQSGTSVAAVDGFFFVNGRRQCLETEPPTCQTCPISEPCAQAKQMFQPVFRTTAY